MGPRVTRALLAVAATVFVAGCTVTAATAPRARLSRRRAWSGTSIARAPTTAASSSRRPAPRCASRACMNEPQCVAFTYMNPGVQGPNARCWLKNTVPQPVPQTCCVSGTKYAGAPPPPAAAAAAAAVELAGAPTTPPPPPPPPPSWQGTPTTPPPRQPPPPRRVGLAGDADHAAARAAAAAVRLAGHGRRRRPRRPPPGSGSRRPIGRAPTTAASICAAPRPELCRDACWGERAVPRVHLRTSGRAGSARALLAQERGSARAAQRLLSFGREVARGGDATCHNTRRRSNGRAGRPTSGWANTRASTPGRSTAA